MRAKDYNRWWFWRAFSGSKSAAFSVKISLNLQKLILLLDVQTTAESHPTPMCTTHPAFKLAYRDIDWLSRSRAKQLDTWTFYSTNNYLQSRHSLIAQMMDHGSRQGLMDLNLDLRLADLKRGYTWLLDPGFTQFWYRWTRQLLRYRMTLNSKAGSEKSSSHKDVQNQEFSCYKRRNQ